jgi:hypothetical protein
MSEAPTPPVPAQAEKATTSPVADLNAKTARRQKLLLGTIGAVILAGGSWFILGGDDGAKGSDPDAPQTIDTAGLVNRDLSQREFVATYGNRLDAVSREQKALKDTSVPRSEIEAQLAALKSENQARVIVGVDASAGVSSQTDPLPVVLRITGPARSVMQNGKVLTTRIEGCIVNGAARGDLSSEKVYVKLARMTCDQPGGRVAVSEVKGFISFAGKSGVRGRVVSREGNLVSQALLAGIVGGFGRGFSANANGIFAGQLGAGQQRPSLSATDIVAGGLGQGAGEAADTVSRYLIERAEQYQPVVEMPTGIAVEIVFLDGVYVRNSQ